jgi:hypothetical protein
VPGKRVQIDEETWHALEVLRRGADGPGHPRFLKEAPSSGHAQASIERKRQRNGWRETAPQEASSNWLMAMA